MCGIIPMPDIKPLCLNKNKPHLFYELRRVSPMLILRESIKNKRFESVYKPSSVVYGHLSRLTVTDKLKRCSRYSVGRTALLTDTQSCSEWGLHGILCYHNIGELLPRLSILTANRQLQKEFQNPKVKLFTAVYFCCTILKVAFT